MTALGLWLKQLIMVVLLAVFADLLLPTKAMQKYVRVVMGLAVIAVLLQPIRPLFSSGWADKLAEYATQSIVGNPSGVVNSTAEHDLETSLHEQEEVQTNRLVADQLRRQMQTELGVTPEDLVISGASEGGAAIHARLVLTGVENDKVKDVQQWLAAKLGVGLDQIEIVRS